MRLWSKIHQCMVDTCGIYSNGTLACITDAGQWVHLPQSDLSRKPCNPDMSITVGHIIDNPTFPFDGMVEITETEDDGTVYTLWQDEYGGHPSVDILIRKVTYMVVTSHGTLRIEVG